MNRVVLIVLAIAIVPGLFAWGGHHLYSRGFDAGQAQEREAVRAAIDERSREEQRMAHRLADDARAEAQAARNTAHQLRQEIARGRTALVVAPACPGALADAAGTGGGPATGDGADPAPSTDAGSKPHVPRDAELPTQLPGGAGHQLTADAVRVWNSALAGHHVPAGACTAAGAPAGACAAASGATLEDAWGNHVENAVRCGEDRARHRALIEFLRSREDAPAVR